MNYPFLLKAQNTPDLQDFCEYIAKPLLTLKELQERYPKNSDNQILHLRLEKIIDNYLPELVDNYCALSTDYRINRAIKKVQTSRGEKTYTPKELLLQGAAKIIEEIYILEDEFNFTYKKKLLVQEKILDNIGAYEPDEKIILHNTYKNAVHVFKSPENEVSNLVDNAYKKNVLSDKKTVFLTDKTKIFDIKKYKKTGFSKISPTSIEEKQDKKIAKPIEESVSQGISGGFTRMYIMEFALIFIVMIMGAMKIIEDIRERHEYQFLLKQSYDLDRIKHFIALDYENKKTYDGLDSTYLKKLPFIDNNYQITLENKAQNSKQYSVTYHDVPLEICNYLVKNNPFSQVEVGDELIKSQNKNLKHSCGLEKSMDIVFTHQE